MIPCLTSRPGLQYTRCQKDTFFKICLKENSKKKPNPKFRRRKETGYGRLENTHTRHQSSRNQPVVSHAHQCQASSPPHQCSTAKQAKEERAAVRSARLQTKEESRREWQKRRTVEEVAPAARLKKTAAEERERERQRCGPGSYIR